MTAAGVRVVPAFLRQATAEVLVAARAGRVAGPFARRAVGVRLDEALPAFDLTVAGVLGEPPATPFRLAVGQDRVVRFTLARPAGEPSTADWLVRFRLFLHDGSARVLTVGSGVARVDDGGGWDVHLSRLWTAGLPARVHRWDFWRTYPGAARPVARGTCDVYRAGG